MTKFYFACALVAMFAVSNVQAAALHYFVKKGDTLSQIALDHIGVPIYGKQGTIEKALENNPIIKDPDKIYVGDELLLTSEGILVKRLATPEQIAHAETVDALPAPMPSPTPEPAPEVAAKTEAPKTKAPLTHGTIALRGSVGPTYYHLSQSGALGNFSQSGLNVGLSGNVLATFGDGRVEFEYKHLSANFDGESKQLQNFLIKGGYKFIVIGFDEGTAPIASATDVTTWKDLTTISPLLGVHFDWGFEKDSTLEYRESFDVEGELPVSVEKDSTSSFLSATNVSGFGARVRARIEKSIYGQGKFHLYVGIEGVAGYQSLHFNGALGDESGDVTRTLQMYQGMLTVNAEL